MNWQQIGLATRKDGQKWAVYKAPVEKPYYKARPVGSVPTCAEGGYFDLAAMLEFMGLKMVDTEKVTKA